MFGKIKVILFVVAAMLSLCWSPLSSAIDSYILDKEAGWFWYQREPEPPEVLEPPKPEPPTPEPQIIRMAPPTPEKQVEPLSVDWFKENYRKILNKAVDDPSPENVAEYRYTNRVMLDKASNFTHEFKRQAALDPTLDESNRYPFTSTARGSFQRYTSKQKQETIESIAKKSGIWVFLDEACVFCSMQYPIINRLAKERGFLITYITPDGKRPSWVSKSDEVVRDRGQSKMLSISVRPATVLVVPPKQILVLSQGMMAQDAMEERILFAGDNAGLMDAEQRGKVFPNEKGLLTTDDIKEAGKAMEGNSKELTSKVKELIQKRN